MPRSALGFWFLSLSLFDLARAALSNRTIDDEQGDAVTGLQPVYGGSWNYGPECPGCFVQPDASRCFDTSWHDTTIDPPAAPSTFPYVNLTFNGTAIYVFAVVPNTVLYATTTTNATFTLDGDLVGTYLHNPNSSTTYEYDVPVYVNKSMPNGQHLLQVEAQAGTSGSYFAFDYAVYTYDDTPTPSSSSSASASSSQTSTGSPTVTPPLNPPTPNKSSSTGAIVGGVVGSLVGLGALILAAFCIRRRKRGAADVIRPGLHGAGPDLDMIEAKIEPFHQGASHEGFSTQPLLTAFPSSTNLQAGSTSSLARPGEAPRSEASGFTQYDNHARDVSVSSTDPPVPSSMGTVPTVAAGATAATSRGIARARTQKAVLRQQELARQMREIERTVASLNAQRSTPTAATEVEEAADHDESAEDALRSQVEALQLEVERLRAEQEQQRLLAMEPPPAYEPADEGQGLSTLDAGLVGDARA